MSVSLAKRRVNLRKNSREQQFDRRVAEVQQGWREKENATSYALFALIGGRMINTNHPNRPAQNQHPDVIRQSFDAFMDANS